MKFAVYSTVQYSTVQYNVEMRRAFEAESEILEGKILGLSASSLEPHPRRHSPP